MKKKQVFTVIEYEKIVSDEFVPEDGEGYKRIPVKAFKELDSFVKDYKYNEEYDSLDFFNIGHNHQLGDYISTKNYVGLIELKGGYQIQIFPKLELGESMEETKRVFRKMLSSMKDFPAKISESASLKEERMNLYEVFIDMYVSDVQKLIKTGLKSNYTEVEDNLNKVKGKILINEQIRYNLVHKERFYVRFDEYNVNRPENRIIKATLLKLQGLTSYDKTQMTIQGLLTFFDDVEISYNYEKDFSKVSLDRSMKRYKDLMVWSSVFLLDKSFSTFSGKNDARALLFPMEKLFESYVARELGKVLDSKWTLSTQDRGFYLFDNPQFFAIRPDLVLRNSNGRVVVLDTKWKRLVPNIKKKYGISQSDMYQMYAYSRKYEASDIWVLYPETPDMNNKREYVFESNTPNGENTTVHLFFVNMGELNISECMKNLISRINDES